MKIKDCMIAEWKKTKPAQSILIQKKQGIVISLKNHPDIMIIRVEIY